MPSPRIALFVLEALPNARAVRRFVAEHADEIAFVGLSNAERPNAGGLWGQIKRHYGRSGPGFMPYLAINFGLPDIANALFPLLAFGRRRSLPAAAVPLSALCRQLRIPTLRVDDVNGAAVAAAFATYRPDLIVSFHFDQIFSAETLGRAPQGGVNVHPSLLPRHRGPTPTIHALAEEPPAFGVTVHRLVPKIDAGAILAQEAVDLPSGTSATHAAMRLHDRARALLDRVLDALGRNEAVEGVPPGPLLPYCPFPNRALLRQLHQRGRRVTTAGDLWSALTLSGLAAPSRDQQDQPRP